MNEPRRLRHGQNALIAELLEAGRREEPSPELVARALRSAALGVGAGLMAVPAAAALPIGGASTGAASAGSASAGGTTTSALASASVGGSATVGAAGTASTVSGAGAAGGSLAGTGAAGATAHLPAAAAVVTKTSLAGVALAKWVGAGVLGLSVATGAPKILHWVEQRPSVPTMAGGVAPLAAPSPERAAALASLPEPRASRPESPVLASRPEPPVLSPAPVTSTEHTSAPEPRAALAAAQRPARAPITAARRHARSEAASAAPRTLGFELQTLDRAREALQRGEAVQTLRELQSYEHDAPEQQLRLEVAMLRMEAYAALGDMARARTLAAAILAQPVSPLHAARAREISKIAEASH